MLEMLGVVRQLGSLMGIPNVFLALYGLLEHVSCLVHVIKWNIPKALTL